MNPITFDFDFVRSNLILSIQELDEAIIEDCKGEEPYDWFLPISKEKAWTSMITQAKEKYNYVLETVFRDIFNREEHVNDYAGLVQFIQGLTKQQFFFCFEGIAYELPCIMNHKK